jgi:cobyrinic acid a,c-diamide synthase
VPALYLIKEPIKNYSSIKIGASGWRPLNEAVTEASQNHDFLIVEGAMSAFTGLLNEKAQRPSSTAEVAAALGASTILVVGCEKEGIEGALVNTLNYIKFLKSLGVKTTGVILNKMSTSYLTEQTNRTIKQALENAGVKLVGVVPRMNLESRGMIPEIEIRYEEFGAQAVDAAERYLDLDLLAKLAEAPRFNEVDYDLFTENFKKLLTNFTSNANQGGKKQKCS